MRLPKSVQEIADVIGRERALYLVGQLKRCVAGAPGKQSWRLILYVPTLQRLTLQHYLVRILGYNDAVKMCRAFGGEIMYPANCAEIYRGYRDRMIDKFLREGMATAHIAAIVGVTDRHVRSMQSEIPQEELPKAANDNAPTKRKARAANERNSRNQR